MSAILEDYQFEIDDVVFGIGSPVSIDAEGFDPGVNDVTSQDRPNASTDSVAFGNDFITPSLWTWDAFTTADDTSDAIQAVSDLGVVWNDRELRRSPGLTKKLRYGLDGRTRVIFGRPRAFGQVMTNKVLHGEIPISLEFQPADALHYEDEVRYFSVSGQPSTAPGFTFPMIFPMTTIGDAEPTTDSLPGFGGDAYAPFEVTFRGGTNPKLYTDDWEIGLDATLGEDETITVSTYPWGIRAIRSDGVKVAGLLTMQTRLTKARLSPAGEQVRFSAIDSVGVASCTIAWRAAFTTI